MNYYYRIVGWIVEFTVQSDERPAFLQPFRYQQSETQTDIAAEIFYAPLIEEYYGVKYLNTTEVNAQKHPHIFLTKIDQISAACASTDYRSLCIYWKSKNEMALMECLLMGFYSYVSTRQTLLMHASAVEYRGKSLVFTAPSGTGKTTQAELWAKHRNAVILNGDKVFLKQEPEGICAWGSPWKGSSPYAVNDCAPVSAIIVLRQAPENRIRKLDGLEAMQLFMPHVFIPHWDETCASAVMDFLDVVMQNIPIYLLECRPDEEAVVLTERTIFGAQHDVKG